MTERSTMANHSQNEVAPDLYAERRKQKRRQTLKRLFVFLLLSVLALTAYAKRDAWLSVLRDLGMERETVRRNEGVLSDGNFPLSIFGNKEYQTGKMDDLLVLLCDSECYFYTVDGTKLATRQHTHGNAMLETAGNYALVYETGGTGFRLETEKQTVYEQTCSDSILFGRLSEDGYAALVTTSETSACKLLVYNAEGKQIYARSCVEKLVDIGWNRDGSGCYAVSLRAHSGTLQSVVHAYDFSKTEDIWSSEPLDMLCISVYNTESGHVWVMGDTGCCYLDKGGAVLRTYTYPSDPICMSTAKDTAAVLLYHEEKRTGTVMLLSGAENEPVWVDYDQEVKWLEVNPDGMSVNVQTNAAIDQLRLDGSIVSTTAVSDSYHAFFRIVEYLFLMRYDRIDRVKFTE